MSNWGGRWTKVAPVVGWAFNLVVLFGNEWCGGYKWGKMPVMGGVVAWLVSRPFGLSCVRGERATLIPRSVEQDDEAYGGILRRWHINWNITMLRLISFNLDYYWAFTSSPPPLPPPASVSPKVRPSLSPFLPARADPPLRIALLLLLLHDDTHLRTSPNGHFAPFGAVQLPPLPRLHPLPALVPRRTDHHVQLVRRAVVAFPHSFLLLLLLFHLFPTRPPLHPRRRVGPKEGQRSDAPLLRLALPRLPVDDGTRLALDVRRGYQG